MTYSFAQTKVISTGQEWQYYDLEAPPIADWQKQTNLTDDWKTGASPLGYGSFDLATVINDNKQGGKKHITKYFKRTFELKDPFAHLLYKLNVQMDDGVVIYLNDTEVYRLNMPEGEIDNTTRAVSQIVAKKIETSIHTKLLFPEALKYGINTISASVHQGSPNSVDCLFNLELIGESNPEAIPLLLKERTLESLSMNSRIRDLNNKLELEKKDLQLEVIKQSNTNYKTAFYSILAVFSICVLVLLFTLFNTRKKLLAFQEDIKDLKEINSNKDRELMSSSLNTIQTQQFLKEIKGNMENTVTEDVNAIKKEIKRTIRQIDYTIEHDDDWINLSTHFNTLHVGYLDKLAQKHPSLTEMELRHCMFIKLFMQTKEIAQLLHVDPRSVQAARYRIKKKMNLGEHVDMKTYLQEF